MTYVCRLCQADDSFTLLDFGEQPIAHRFLSKPGEDEYVHPLTLRFCEHCGLIQIPNPILQELMYTRYNWFSSWKVNPHISRLVELIGQLPGLSLNSKIVEVATNDGTFLQVLRDQGYQDVLGIEPAQDACAAAQSKGIDAINAYFTRATVEPIVSARGTYDLLIARHVMEHVEHLQEFTQAIDVLLSPTGYVLIEVPNFEFDLSVCDYSGVWEQHVNYFTLDNLSLLLSGIGIRVIQSETVVFSGEAVYLIGQRETGQPLPQSLPYVGKLRAKAQAYRDRWPLFKTEFVRYLHDSQAKGDKVAIFGAGHRSCALINFVGLSDYLEFIVDDQTARQGQYMPGSGLPILPSDELEKQAVDLCLLGVNAEVEDKVIARFQSYQDKGGRFASVFPPSERLLPLWVNNR